MKAPPTFPPKSRPQLWFLEVVHSWLARLACALSPWAHLLFCCSESLEDGIHISLLNFIQGPHRVSSPPCISFIDRIYSVHL